jgi:hypothetical protein
MQAEKGEGWEEMSATAEEEQERQDAQNLLNTMALRLNPLILRPAQRDHFVAYGLTIPDSVVISQPIPATGTSRP